MGARRTLPDCALTVTDMFSAVSEYIISIPGNPLGKHKERYNQIRNIRKHKKEEMSNQKNTSYPNFGPIISSVTCNLLGKEMK
jgi:hypothetical protein